MKRNKQWNEKNRRGAYRGAALRLLASHDEDVTCLTRLVEEEGRADLAYHLAISLSNRGSAFCDVHRAAWALVDYNKAAGILTRLIKQEGRTDLVGVLASVLTSRGSAFTDLGHLPEALADHDRAVATFTRLIEEEGRTDLAAALGLSLTDRGKTLGEVGKVPTALADYDKGIALLTRVVNEDDVAELATLVTRARRDREKLLRRHGTRTTSVAALKRVGKRKEPSAELRPSRNQRWNRAKTRFQLSSQELAMAQATGFTPTQMDHTATGSRRSGKEKLPRTAAAEQIEMIKRVIRERYAIETRRQRERACMTKLTVMIPTELKAHVGIECARAGLMLDEEIQALLMARFPRSPRPTVSSGSKKESDEA